METGVSGMWSDPLKTDEVDRSKKCAEELNKIDEWKPFLNEKKVFDAINVEPNKNRTPAEAGSIKSALFEVRIAFWIHSSGLRAEYEYCANPDSQKSIDFKVFGNRLNNYNLLIEVSSLRESESQKNKTWSSGDFFECKLDGKDDTSAYIKAQGVLIEKAVKFSSENNDDQVNAIILDMRSAILGSCDSYDYVNILYGSEKLPFVYQRYLDNGKLFPGIFCSTHPMYNDNAWIHLRKSIHYFGFVRETTYAENELPNEIVWLKNPDLECLEVLKLRDILCSATLQSKSGFLGSFFPRLFIMVRKFWAQ